MVEDRVFACCCILLGRYRVLPLGTVVVDVPIGLVLSSLLRNDSQSSHGLELLLVQSAGERSQYLADSCDRL